MTLTTLVGLVGRAREAVRLSPPLPHHILFWWSDYEPP